MRLSFVAVIVCAGCASGPPTPPQAKIDAIEAPIVACTAPVDAGPDADAGEPPCMYPPATCADDHFLVYFTQGRCANGTCSYQKKTYQCVKSCAGNACVSPHEGPTAAAADTPPDFWQ